MNDNKALTSLVAPKLKSIGDYFLRFNEALTSLEIPNVESIGDGCLRCNSNIDLYNMLELKCK